MADPGKVYPTDVHLLMKELEIQGELLNQERLDRRIEIDRLRIEIESIKRLLQSRQTRQRRQRRRPGARRRPRIRSKRG